MYNVQTGSDIQESLRLDRNLLKSVSGWRTGIMYFQKNITIASLDQGTYDPDDK